MVEKLQRIAYETEYHRFKSRVESAAFYVSQAVRVYLFGLGKDTPAKREGWAPSFICCAQDTMGL